MVEKSNMSGAAAARERKKEKSPAERVLVALSDPKYDFRTLEGLAKATELSSDSVLVALGALGQKVRISNVTDPQGRVLYTLRNRPKKLRERLSELRSFMSASTSAGKG